MNSNNIKITPKWKRSKEDIWVDKFENLSDTKATKKFSIKKVISYSAAAGIAMFLTLTITSFLYSKEIISAKGKHLSILLPDGSKVEMNADSKISYKPYWWSISRNVKMDGECFFEVVKGERFTVISPKGIVKVLGTSFNIYSRGEDFDVTCITGKIKVEHNSSMTVITKNMQAKLNRDTLITTVTNTPEYSIGWKNGIFYFNETPLWQVINEIERQYDIDIEYPRDLNYIYSGVFNKDKTIDEVLNIIGDSFDITLTIK